MAVRPETQQIKQRLGMVYMSVEEGVWRVLEEIKHGLPEAEILITTGEHLRRMQVDHLVVEDLATVNKLEARKSPLFETSEVNEGSHSFSMTLFPDTDPFLAQHRFKGRPLFPLVMGIEAFLQGAQSALQATDRQSLTLYNLKVHGPLRFVSDSTVEAVVRLQEIELRRKEAETKHYRAELYSYFKNQAGQRSPKPRLHFTAEVCQTVEGDRVALEHLAGSVQREELSGLRDVAIRDDLVLYHGPIFRQVKQIAIHGSHALATVCVPEIRDVAGQNRNVEGWISSPAVVDACLFACGIQLYVSDSGAVSVPMGIDRITFHLPLQSDGKLWLRILNRGIKGDEACFDFVLCDQHGTPYISAEGYCASIVTRTSSVQGMQA